MGYGGGKSHGHHHHGHHHAGGHHIGGHHHHHHHRGMGIRRGGHYGSSTDCTPCLQLFCCCCFTTTAVTAAASTSNDVALSEMGHNNTANVAVATNATDAGYQPPLSSTATKSAQNTLGNSITLCEEKSDYQTIRVIEYTMGKHRALFLNDEIQFSTLDERTYHACMVHAPLSLTILPIQLAASTANEGQLEDSTDAGVEKETTDDGESDEKTDTPNDERLIRTSISLTQPLIYDTYIRKVLIIGGGDGGVLRELVKYKSITHIDWVEIDAKVSEICVKYFESMAIAEPMKDNRVTVINADAKQWCEDRLSDIDTSYRGYYDLIVLDLTEEGSLSEPLNGRKFWDNCVSLLNSEKGLIMRNGRHYYLSARVKSHFCQCWLPTMGDYYCFTLFSVNPNLEISRDKPIDFGMVESVVKDKFEITLAYPDPIGIYNGKPTPIVPNKGDYRGYGTTQSSNKFGCQIL